GDVATEVGQLRTRLEQAEAGLHAAEEERRRMATEEQQAHERQTVSLGSLITAEKAARLADLDAHEAALTQEEQQLRAKAEDACRELHLSDPAGSDLTQDAIEARRTLWLEDRQRTQQRLAFLQGWVACLEKDASSYAARLPRLCNVV